VHTPSVPAVLDPRQEKYISPYTDPASKFFGNSFQSATAAGYSVQTARNLTHNRRGWLSIKLGQLKVMEPELLLLKLTTIINNPAEPTQNKLRAIDMMMKHFQMFGADGMRL
jgi:hypothetical protein